MNDWRLVGSAATLTDIVKLIENKWNWTIAATPPADEKDVWNLMNSKGPIDRVRIKLSKGRYRFEVNHE